MGRRRSAGRNSHETTGVSSRATLRIQIVQVLSMSHVRCLRALGSIALASVFCNLGAHAQQIKTVFVIAMENHNWTQPANQFTGGIQQIFQNPNAPYINSLVNGTSDISDQVAYATA